MRERLAADELNPAAPVSLSGPGAERLLEDEADPGDEPEAVVEGPGDSAAEPRDPAEDEG